MVSYNRRSCSKKKSRANPNAYSKDELVSLIMKKLGYSKSQASKLTKEEICKELGNISKSSLPRRKKSSPKRSVKRSSQSKKLLRKQDLRKLGITKLKQLAKESGISGYSKFKSVDIDGLISLILENQTRKQVFTPAPRVNKKSIQRVLEKSPLREEVKLDPIPSVKTSIPRYRSQLSCLNGLKVHVNPHQQLVVEHMLKNRGLVMVHSVGSGKTISSIVTTKCLLDRYPGKKVIIITPKSLQDNYKKELVKVGLSANDERYIFYTFTEFLNMFSRGKYNMSPEICSNNILVVDEAHNLRTEVKIKKSGELISGKTTDIVHKCALKAFKVILLTATPIFNEPYDIVPLVSMAKGIPIMSKVDFELLLGNPLALKNYFSNVISIYTKQKDNIYYPQKHYHDVFLRMTPQFYQEYLKIEKGKLAGGLANLFRGNNLHVFLNGVRRAVNMTLSGFESAKINWIIQKCKEGEQTLVYSAWLEAGQRLIKDKLVQNGIKVGEIHGGLSMEQRTQMVNEFNSGKIQVLLISKAGSEGLDLKKTRNVIITDPGWNSAGEDQVIGRAERYKSHIDLPLNQQRVDIWKLYLIKPSDPTNYDYDIAKLLEPPSVDLMLLKIQKTKELKNNKFMKLLNSQSIESTESFRRAPLTYNVYDFIVPQKRRGRPRSRVV